jgi:hypothetical protein
MKRRKLIAVISDAAALRLESIPTRQILGEYHLWRPDSGTVSYLCCRPPDSGDGRMWRAAADFLFSMGATVLPWHRDLGAPPASGRPNPVAALPAAANVGANDTAWQAHQKMFEHTGWPFFDPMLD